MTKGFDCATRLTADVASRFAADGYAFVGRYLVPSGWKRLTREEAEAISAAGLQIISVFETAPSRSLGGRAAGLVDGDTALQTARNVGQPEGSCIYTAVDFDASPAQLPTIIEYIAAFSEATPGYFTGVYGSYRVIEAVRAAGACSRFWQTYAWSRGGVSDANHIYQWQNDITVNGIGIDENKSYGNEGWWNTLESVEPAEEELEMDIKYATVLIGLAKAAWREGVTKIELEDGTMQDVQEQDIREAANAARRASGQPEE